MWIQRDFSEKILTFATQYPIIVVMGARQVGKSSLIKKIFPHYNYISLDLPSDSEFAEQDPENFLKTYQYPLIIDEIQYAPKLFRWIKKIVDENPKLKGAFILSGSQKFTLMSGIQESLAGRAMIVDILPLSLHEIFSHSQMDLTKILLRGGLPALYADETMDSFNYYRSYMATYLERDVKEILNVSSLRDFERFIRICAYRTSSLINKADMARDVGVSPVTINQWLSVLETSNQVKILEPWFTNKSKSIIKTPKLYFCDTGLLTFLLNIKDEETFSASPLKGALWENFVFCEIYKQLTLEGLESSLFFWRDRHKEVDFIIDRGGALDLIEVKWNSSPSASVAENIKYFEKSALSKKMFIHSRSVLTSSKKTYPLGDSGINVQSILDFKIKKITKK